MKYFLKQIRETTSEKITFFLNSFKLISRLKINVDILIDIFVHDGGTIELFEFLKQFFMIYPASGMLFDVLFP